VCSSVAEGSGSVAGDRERPADPVAEEREPFDGLVAEHEADNKLRDRFADQTDQVTASSGDHPIDVQIIARFAEYRPAETQVSGALSRV
jgi:hypothetical protein